MSDKSEHIRARGRRTLKRFGFREWMWWWEKPSRHAIPAPDIHTTAYQEKLYGEVDKAIAADAIDAYTAGIWDSKIDADTAIDIQQLAEEHSRRRTLIQDQIHRHETREQAAQRRLRRIKRRLTAETKNLREMDRLLAERRPIEASAPSNVLEGHFPTAAGNDDEKRKERDA